MSELRPTNRKRIVVRLNKNLHMSPNKAAAQAVHAALHLFGVHPGEEVPVVVLSGSKTTVEAQQAVISDHGVTEVKPGSITAGASWDFPVEEGEDPIAVRLRETLRQRLATAEDAQTKMEESRDAYFDYIWRGVEPENSVPFGHKDN